ncbi:MAG TPA: ankyrin repeat domain-containing protein [candidate division Zixibacteria bacterium]|nr:ankyrin repeat domain-containing protein [candidate division Zixibacteria bacterium]MDD4916337.1 ankyrin repeat domain-containing protein [candidate division Zixibacteria bacterium]MDM7971853.1 ankyrin repeat domain-containing protein [candidate division Zixibacteria bacterium]HOD66373.1 ankyrin repeat domain-containing protein [candidate division Zixibacteria bacterium]
MTGRTFALCAAVVLLAAVRLPAAEIHDAVAAGDVERVRVLLAADPSLINARDSAQNLPLHVAALQGRTAMIELLLAEGADINIGDRENTSPLTIAAMRNHLDAVRLLAERGAQAAARDINGETPLISAARRGNLEMVRCLVAHGAPLYETSARGSNCLHIAASIGADSLAAYLLAQEFDINARNGDGRDALYFAAANGFTSIALRLIAQGADVQYRNEQGETRLHTAVFRGDTVLAGALVAAGLAIDARDNWGVTPLTNACWGTVDMVRWLLDHGADVNARTDSTHTPLSIAVLAGHADLVRLLVGRGADVNYHGRLSGPALQSAAVQGNDEIAGILLQAGADPEFTDADYGRTMLHIAAIRGDSALARVLLDHGVPPAAQDRSGRTPLYYAVHYANPSVAALLRDAGAAPLPAESEADPPDLLAATLGEKEAVVWYLNHSGWAIRTARHFLIFDYALPPCNPDSPCLANGRIDPSEIKDLKVMVFSSHEHRDHYDTSIFAWRNAIPDISYVLGHRQDGAPAHRYLGPRSDEVIDGMRVRTIDATDAGVGFLVEVDGVVIFHAGDHANGQVGLHAPYTDEIDYLASLGAPIDLAFLPILGCSLGTPESVREGVVYALQKLSPAVYFPQHAMNSEYRFRAFSDGLKRSGLTVQTGLAENGGDCFRYRGNRIL